MTYKPGQKRGVAGTDLGGQFIGPKSIARALIKALSERGHGAAAKDLRQNPPHLSAPKKRAITRFRPSERELKGHSRASADAAQLRDRIATLDEDLRAPQHDGGRMSHPAERRKAELTRAELQRQLADLEPRVAAGDERRRQHPDMYPDAQPHPSPAGVGHQDSRGGKATKTLVEQLTEQLQAGDITPADMAAILKANQTSSTSVRPDGTIVHDLSGVTPVDASGRTSAEAAKKSAAAKVAAAKAAKVPTDQHVTSIQGLKTSADVGAYLDSHPMTAAELRSLAEGLGPTVPKGGKTKAALRQGIIDGTTGFRERSDALLPGGWRMPDSAPSAPAKSAAPKVRAAKAANPDVRPDPMAEHMAVQRASYEIKPLGEPEMPPAVAPKRKAAARVKAAKAAAPPTRADTLLANDIAGMGRSGDERGLPVYLDGMSLARIQGAARVLGVDVSGLDRSAAAAKVSRHALDTKPGWIDPGKDPVEVLTERITAAGSEQAMLDVLRGEKIAQLRKVAKQAGILIPPGMRDADAVRLHIARSLSSYGS